MPFPKPNPCETFQRPEDGASRCANCGRNREYHKDYVHPSKRGKSRKVQAPKPLLEAQRDELERLWETNIAAGASPWDAAMDLIQHVRSRRW